MNLLSALFGRKPKSYNTHQVTFDLNPKQAKRAGLDIDPLDLEEMSELPAPYPDMDPFAAQSPAAEAPAASAQVNIWDLEDDNSAPVAPQPDRSTARARRNRTRLIGFDKSDGDVVDLFEEKPTKSEPVQGQFPVGWLLIVDGPGRGHCFSILAGMAQIGRGDDQTIQLDFGDRSISRSNHAAIVFDADTQKFILGHGGKANLVRLNNQPVISNEVLADGDQIRIGATTLQLKALCGADFDWSTAGQSKEQTDVAIA